MNSNNDGYNQQQQQKHSQQHQHQNHQRFASSMAKRKQKLHEYSSASPPLTEDSGQWSSSFPSSPIKEQSPHNSGHVKSSSGSTSSCEFNNNSRKSELYGTPHWWPLEQEPHDDGKSGQLPKLKTCGSDPVPASISSTDAAAAKANPSTAATSLKYNRPLAFTINFRDDEEDEDGCDRPETEGQVDEKPSSSRNSVTKEGINLSLPGASVIEEKAEEEPKNNIDVQVEQISDVKSDNGTYTLEDDDGSFVQEDRGAALGLNQIDNNDWIQKWATEASAHVPADIHPIPPYDETFKILDETRSIVNAMQDRVSCEKKPKPKPRVTETASSIKFNRAFNIRRTLNTSPAPAPAAPIQATYESDNGMTRSSMSDTFHTKSNNFSRADGGRFSLRIKKGMQGSQSDTEVKHFPYVGSLPSKPKIGSSAVASRPLTNSPVRSKSILGPNSVRPSGYSGSASSGVDNNNSSSKLHARSNSTITSRDIEMENWKRRKSYDPLKAAGMGITNKSKVLEEPKKKDNVNLSTKPVSATATKFVASNSLTRPKNLNVQKPQQQREFPDPATTPASSVHSHSPVPHDHCCSSSASLAGGDYVRVQDWIQLQQLNRSSCDQLSTQRKFEALDTLVISTIFSLTNKVRNLSLGLLKKIQPGQQADDENSALLEEMITQLSEMSTQHVDKQGQKSSSKELSGILKNVKKIEQVILVLDRVLCDQDDEESCSDC